MEELYSNTGQSLGLRYISKLIEVLDDSKDSWLCYQVGNIPLSKHMFEVKGEFYCGERIYSVLHKDFYEALSRNNIQILKDFVRFMAQVLETLTEKKIVHADLKPDNILIDFDG